MTALGLLCIAAAVILFISNIVEARRAGELSSGIVSELTEMIDEQADASRDFPTDNPDREMPAFTVMDKRYAGLLGIPELDLELPVLAAFDYASLNSSPCLYSGSVYSGNMVIAAHNYSSHFGRLGRLGIGSQVSFIDVESHTYDYEVYSVETLSPSQESELTDSASYPRELTLFTCTYSGADRIVLRCRPIDTRN